MYTQPNLTQILKDGLEVFQKEWKLLVGINAAIMITILAFTILEAISSWFVIPLIFCAIFFVPIIIIVNATISSRSMLGKKTKVGDVWSVVQRKIFKVLLTILLIILIIFVAFIVLAPVGVGVWFLYQSMLPTLASDWMMAFGFFLFVATIIGGLMAIITIILSTYMIFSLYISVLEREWGFQAIKKSFHIIKGNWWQTFGKILAIQLIVTVIMFAVQFIFAPVTLAATSYMEIRTVNGVVSLIQQLIALPFTISLVVFYIKTKQSNKDIKTKDTHKKLTTQTKKKVKKVKAKK